jgi:hypothetical protein
MIQLKETSVSLPAFGMKGRHRLLHLRTHFDTKGEEEEGIRRIEATIITMAAIQEEEEDIQARALRFLIGRIRPM